MRRLILLAAAAATLVTVASAAPISVPASTPAAGPVANEYEMTTYQVAFLKRGPAWTPGDSPEHQKLQEAHMAHIRRMAETGKLLVAGPFTDDGDLRGMFVFRASSLEEAKALAEQDPTVQAGRLILEWHPWFAAKNIAVTAKAAK